MTNQQLQYELLVYRSLKMKSLLNVVHKLTAQKIHNPSGNEGVAHVTWSSQRNHMSK